MEGQLPFDVTFHRAEDGLATLRTAGGHEFRWPEDRLPQPSSPGDSIRLDLRAAAGLSDEEKMRTGIAMLNEILRAT